ncbi:MAG TPA: helix-turn-helix domain-containing protein [Blastocatellia bacterium]|nr:helix-turn-helix domain-containing protein [Blastocatellia bacterium]
MSRHYRDLAWQMRYRAEKKLVLLFLAERADDDGICWPSMPVIAEACEITQRGAEKIIAAFVKDGVITRVTAGGGRGRSTVYRLELPLEVEQNPGPPFGVSEVKTPNGETPYPETPNLEPGLLAKTPNRGPGFRDENPERRNGVSKSKTPNEETETPNGVTKTPNEEAGHVRKNRHENRHENRQHENHMSSSGNSTDGTKESTDSKPKHRKSDRADEITQVFEHWKLTLNHPNGRLDEKRKQKIRARLAEGFNVEDLKLAIDGCSKSPFHQGDNDRNKVFDDIELICRDAAHVERFMGYVANPPAAKSSGGQKYPRSVNGHQQINAANTPREEFLEHCVKEFQEAKAREREALIPVADFVEGELIP